MRSPLRYSNLPYWTASLKLLCRNFWKSVLRNLLATKSLIVFETRFKSLKPFLFLKDYRVVSVPTFALQRGNAAQSLRGLDLHHGRTSKLPKKRKYLVVAAVASRVISGRLR
jgi:hypothetical protein